MSSDGTSWSTTPAASLVTAAGFGSSTLNATTIPATDGVLIGCGVYGAPNAARPAFQIQVSSPLTFPSAATVSPVTAVATIPVALTLTATGFDTANSSTCALYYVVGKTYTLLGTGTLTTAGTSALSCTFPLAGTYKLAFTVTNRAGVQSGYVATTSVSVSPRPYVYRTGASTTTTTAFTSNQTPVQLLLTGGDTIEASVSVLASKSASDPAPVTVCAFAKCASTGAATATCVFPSAGTWYLFVKANNPEATQSVTLTVATTVAVSDYTDPATVTLSTLSAYAGVPSSVSLSLAAQAGTRRTITVYYDASASATAPTQCGTGDVYDGTVTVTCTFPVAGTFYVYVSVTSPVTGTASALVRSTATISVTSPAPAQWIKLASTYTSTKWIANTANRTYSADGSTLSVAAPSCTQAVGFSEFFNSVLVGDFSIIIKLVNTPPGLLLAMSSPNAATSILSTNIVKDDINYYGAQWYTPTYYSGPNNYYGFAVGSTSQYLLLCGGDPYAQFRNAGGYGGIFAIQPSPQADGTATIYLRAARVGTTFKVDASGDGTSWSSSPTLPGLTGQTFNTVSVPETEGILLGYGAYGAANANRPPFQMQLIYNFKFPTAATLVSSGPVAYVQFQTTITLTATGYDTANCSTCSLYCVVGKTYTLLGSGMLKTTGTAVVPCTFPSTGTFTVAFKITNVAGVQSGYIVATPAITVSA
jgi:hypothetical protein